MKTRYSLFVSLLFCVSLMAQSQNEDIIIKSDTDKASFFSRENYTLLDSEGTFFSSQRFHNPCKVFIGVGTVEHAGTGGLAVDYTVDDAPASISGIRKGDIILALDNVAVSTQRQLEMLRDKHQPGDAFTLSILRGDTKMTVDARFKACSAEEQEVLLERELVQHNRFQHNGPQRAPGFHMPLRDRAILGIFKDEEAAPDAGIVIKEVISGKGAAAAGLQSGDVITSIDGQQLDNNRSLSSILADRKAGDPVTVVYRRNGQSAETQVTLSSDRMTMRTAPERDPCKVFIGVYTSDFGMDGNGVRVSGVIDGTAARESEVKPGDIILEFDKQAVGSVEELHVLRDKHQPGDAFQLTILRDGKKRIIDASFKACPQAGKPEVVELLPEAAPRDNTLKNPETTLQIEVLEAYPNPTLGLLNVRFEAEAVPTTVRLADAAGKTVYNNEMNQFGGNFNEQLNLEGNSPGIYTLTIQQGKKICSRQVILLSKS